MVLRKKQAGITFGYCDPETGQRVHPVPEQQPSTMLLPEQEPPERLPSFEPQDSVGDIKHVQLTCWPPLSQSTVIPSHHSQVDITVCLELGDSDVSESSPPEVVIWHNHNGEHEWEDLEVKHVTQSPRAMLYGRPRNQIVWYQAILSGQPKHGHAVSFTLKLRLSQSHEWTWAREAFGMHDGTLCYQTHDISKHAEHDVRHFFDGFDSRIKLQRERPDTSDTQLFSLTSTVSPANGKESGYSYYNLGTPKRLERWFAEVRLWSPWLAPRQGGKTVNLDKDAILLSFLRSDGLHVAALAISGVKDILTTFVTDEHGQVTVKARNDRPEEGSSIVLVAVASSFDVANAAVFYHARKVVSDYGSSTVNEPTEAVPDDDPEKSWLEEWYDGFTYCTWNSLGQDLSAQKIYDALDDLAKENINITNLIIDDNWQSLSGEQGIDSQMTRGWIQFEANKKGFPDGLKGTTTEIRTKHANIKHIAVWHAMLGYWGGIAPDGLIAKNYKTVQVPKDNGVATVVAAEDVGRMYDDFYKFLSDSGVDSVKTDAQFMLDELHNAPDRKALITEYQDAWTIAHLRHLGSRAISCMSQAPQLIFHSQLPTNKPRLLVRNSDDFFPEVDASHPWHIFCNAHNSIVSQHLNALPDWDMFQTSHKWASFHAAARCVSGGPIYFTDYPGHHNIKLIKQITAQTTSNKTIILRPDRVGKAITPYNDYTSQAVLKVGTYVGHAMTGSGILGIFNVSKRDLHEFLHLSDFPGTEEGPYVVRSFTSGEVSEPVAQKHKYKFGVHLTTTGWDVLSAHKVASFELRSLTVDVALLGLLGKMTGAAALTGYRMKVEDNGRLRIWSSYKALGVVGVYIGGLAKRSIKEDLMVLLYGKPIPEHCVSINSTCEDILELDIERAWKENEERAGWSNEVSIEVFLA